MKRIIAGILSAIMCFSLVGCNDGQTEKADTLHKTISIVQNNNQNRITAEDENYIYFYNHKIDIYNIEQAMKLFIGTKDFKALSAV